jgi:hypothetical protein
MKNLIRKILKEEIDSDWDWMGDHKITIIDILNNVFDGTYGITAEPYLDRDGVDGIQIMINGNHFFRSINLPPNVEISDEGVEDIIDYIKVALEIKLKRAQRVNSTYFKSIFWRALMLINKNYKPLKEEI